MPATYSQKVGYLWRKLRVPVSAFFELTPRCTLDCKMCYVHLTEEQMGSRRELTTEQWLRIADEAVEMGLIRVVLTGGESMLHPGFWEIYEHLRDRGVLVAVNTNGLLLTPENIERFRRNPPASLRITLYGSDDASYARCTGRPAFSRILENVRAARDAGLPLRLAATICRYNSDQTLKILSLARELGISCSYDLEMMEAEEATGRRAETYALSTEEILEQLRQMREFYGVKLELNPPLERLPERLPDDPDCRGLTCGAGASEYVIQWDGRACACFNLETDVFVQEAGLAAAWEAVKKRAMEFLMPVECRSCELRAVCLPCVLLRQAPGDPGHCNPEICRRTVLKYESGLSAFSRHPTQHPGAEESEVCEK